MIYVHVPFCKSFCIYCGFYSELAGRCGTSYMQAYAGALRREIDSRREELDGHRSGIFPRTLYFGGGTPSVLPDGTIEEIIEYLTVPLLEEITVEVNPDDIVLRGRPYVERLMKAGVNRFSIGIQSFDDGVLRWMRRRHDAGRALEAFRILKDAGAGNVSIDLIFGFPLLNDDVWERSLEAAINLHPEHISAYQLGIDEGSDLYELAERGGFEPMGEEACLKQYETLCRCMEDAGYRHYEVSNFALPGYESMHNSAYWDRVPYAGLGPGAHSFRIMPDGRQIRFSNPPDLSGYLSRWSPVPSAPVVDEVPELVEGVETVEGPQGPGCTADGSSDHPGVSTGSTAGVEILTPEQIRIETLMLGLRKADGLPSGEFRRLCPAMIADNLIRRGMLAETGCRIRIPENRLFQSDSIIRELI